MKFSFRKRFIIIFCAAFISTVILGAFIMRKNNTFADDGDITYSSEFVDKADGLANRVLSEMKSNGYITDNYSGDIYGKDMSIADFCKIDDDNACDKHTGKYKDLDNIKKPDDNEHEESEFLQTLKNLEKSSGGLTKAQDGVYIASSFDAIDPDALDLCDIVFYFEDDDTEAETYIKMEDFSKEYESMVIEHMRAKDSVSVRSAVNLHINGTTVTLAKNQFTFDNTLKTISSEYDNAHLLSEFEDVSMDDCFSFLYDYMALNGIKLDLVSHKPDTGWIYDRRYDFENEQDIIKTMEKWLGNDFTLDSSRCCFDFSYQDDADMYCIQSIDAIISGRLSDGTVVELETSYSLFFNYI